MKKLSLPSEVLKMKRERENSSNHAAFSPFLTNFSKALFLGWFGEGLSFYHKIPTFNHPEEVAF